MPDQLQFALNPAEEIEQRIYRLVYSPAKEDAPLDSPMRKFLLEMKWHMGAAHAIPIAALSQKLGLSAREIKELARSAVVDFDLRIVGSRREPYGYYLAITAEELQAAITPLRNELIALARRIRALDGAQYDELLGQLKLEGTV